ncbi:hypothetical protein VT85_11245 [Planctomyces sp. SH-PL62]|nr:hypothetical protein VT85_11245 [Planctomyces sp. SH-PL62]
MAGAGPAQGIGTSYRQKVNRRTVSPRDRAGPSGRAGLDKGLRWVRARYDRLGVIMDARTTLAAGVV